MPIKISSYRQIKIEAGRHYPHIFYDFPYTLNLSYKPLVLVNFSKAKYDMNGDVDQQDWNKLYGRLWYKLKKWKFVRYEEFWVWRYWQGRFQIAKYTREGDTFGAFEIKTVSNREECFLSNDWFTLPLPLGTYFGGDDSDNDGIGGVAPQDITLLYR